MIAIPSLEPPAFRRAGNAAWPPRPGTACQRRRDRARRIWPILLLAGAALGCKEPPELVAPDDRGDEECLIGSESCPCTAGGACDDGLACVSKMCVAQPDDSAGGDGDTDGDADSDSDTDTDSDSDTDGDGDADSDGDGDGDTDTDSDTDADMDADSDADTDTDSDADSDTGQATTHLLIPNEEGWIDASTNALAIQGGWWADGSLESFIAMDVDADGRVCLEGRAAMVVDEEYGIYWGAMAGFDFCTVDEGGEIPVSYPISDCPLNPILGDQLIGIRFDIEGYWYSWREELRVRFDDALLDEDSYVEVRREGHIIARMPDAFLWYAELWSIPEDPYDYPVISDNVIGVQFQIPSNHMYPSDFQLCISNVEAILR